MKLLLIEDNQTLADRLKLQLTEYFVVDHAPSGREGLERIRSGVYAAVLLDLTLPDIPGQDVCQKVREEGYTMPIIILTGIDELITRVRLLNSGADDYVTKPFNMAELRARLRAVLRRSTGVPISHVLKVEDLHMDVHRRRVTRGGLVIQLRRKEFDILEYLMRNRGTIVSRSMIIDHVWEGSKESWHNTVDVHIKNLRDKVDRPFGEPLIKTAYGIGYLMDDKQITKEGVTP